MENNHHLIIKIVEKLKKNNITKIISIDNDWECKQKEFDRTQSLMKFLTERGIDISESVDQEISNDGEIISIEDLINTQNPQLESLKKDVVEQLSRKEEIQPTLEVLNKLFEEINKVCAEITVEKISNCTTSFISSSSNCLYILDKNMGEGNTDVIVKSILNINQQSNQKNDIILVYSSETIKEYESNELKLSYLVKEGIGTDNSLLVYKMWAIKKTGDLKVFLPDLYKVLMEALYGNDLYNIIKYRVDVEKSAYEELMKIDASDLTKSIKDSFVEGDIITQALDRISESLKKKKAMEIADEIYMNSIANLISYEHEKMDDIVTEIGKYSSFRNNCFKEKLTAWFKGNAHHAIVDYAINHYYEDLSTGDIFRFKKPNSTNWNYGILITQACRCVIRIPKKDIREVDRDAKQMQLLLLEAMPLKNTYTDKESEDLNKLELWPVNIKKGDPYIFYPKDRIISVPGFILDLCALSKKGEASLNFDITEAIKYKPYHSKKYFENFLETFFGDSFNKDGQLIVNKYNGLINLAREFEKGEEKCQIACGLEACLVKEAERIENEMFQDAIGLKYGIEYKEKAFTLERVGRLESQRTLMLVQEYTAKLAKAGADPIPAN